MNPLPHQGDVLADRFEVVRELGRGGYSVVYLARDRTLDVPVAIKFLAPPPAVMDEARERLRREASAVRVLAHPNVVALHDFVESTVGNFLVMEFVDGPDLGALVEERGPIAPARAAALARDVAEALAAGHELGVIHRDVKPRNVLVDPDGRGRLTDFGSARLDGLTTMTHGGGLVGTLAYTAPEILAGQRGDGRSDVYALGLTLYFALTGALPAGGPLGPAAAAEGFRPSLAGAEIPAWLDDVVARATRSDPRHRFATALALAHALGSASVPVAPLSLSPGSGRCLICGEDAVDEVGVCPACAASHGGHGSRELVFLKPPASSGDRRNRTRELEGLLGDTVHPRELEAAVRGRRALLSAPAPVAARAAAALTEDGLPAVSGSVLGALQRIPPSFSVLVASGLAVGLAAGALGSTLIGLSSPAMAGLLWLAALERVRKPIVEVRPRRSAVPSEAEREAVAGLVRLSPGAASELLSDLLRLARLLAADEAFDTLDPGGEALSTAVRSGTAVALDLDRLDRALETLGRQAAVGGRDSGMRDAVAEAERARDRLVQCLLSGLAALSRAHGHLSDSARAAPALEEAVRALELDAERQAMAAAEVEAFLAGS